MSVLENVTLAPIKVLKLEQAEAEDRAMALLKRIGLEAKAANIPTACRAASSSASPSSGRSPWSRS